MVRPVNLKAVLGDFCADTCPLNIKGSGCLVVNCQCPVVKYIKVVEAQLGSVIERVDK